MTKCNHRYCEEEALPLLVRCFEHVTIDVIPILCRNLEKCSAERYRLQQVLYGLYLEVGNLNINDKDLSDSFLRTLNEACAVLELNKKEGE